MLSHKGLWQGPPLGDGGSFWPSSQDLVTSVHFKLGLIFSLGGRACSVMRDPDVTHMQWIV